MRNRFSKRLTVSVFSWVAVLMVVGILVGAGCGKNPSGDEGETVMDIDGNEYAVVKIGDQWWMAENLKVTHYRNGDAIPNVTDDTGWAGLSAGAFCAYENSAANASIYGYLYNGYAVTDSRNVAPEGWHVPTDAEWKQLEMFLGMSQAEADLVGLRGTDEGGKLKETGTAHWSDPNLGATNESGFSALPGGERYQLGYFQQMGNRAFFWSSTESGGGLYERHLLYGAPDIFRNNLLMVSGFSIRCVKD